MEITKHGHSFHLHLGHRRLKLFGYRGVSGASKKASQRNYVASALFSFLLVLLVQWLLPGVIPFKTYQLWAVHGGGFTDWLHTARPILAWGYGVTFVVAVLTRNSRSENHQAEAYLMTGELLSIWAGLMEEVCFRWLIFMGAIVSVQVCNWLFFGGWLFHFGIPEWFQLNLFGPIANFFTAHVLSVVPGFNSTKIMHDYLVKPESWAIGAAILSANAFFRNGHRYQGLFGVVNSWFIGMFFFFLMFTYGLPAAIVIHFLYDAGIFFIGYLDRVVERARGD